MMYLDGAIHLRHVYGSVFRTDQTGQQLTPSQSQINQEFLLF